MPIAEPDGWKRAGELLEQRRVELGTRYANLRLFSDERQIDYRLAWDLEHGARSNYRRPTLFAAEVSYGWEPGSIRRVVAGGEPVTARTPELLRRGIARSAGVPDELKVPDAAER